MRHPHFALFGKNDYVETVNVDKPLQIKDAFKEPLVILNLS